MTMFPLLFWLFAIFAGITCGMNYAETWSWVAFAGGVIGAIILREILRFTMRKM